MAVLREANFASIDGPLHIRSKIDTKRVERLRANGHSHQADVESDQERLRITHIDQVIGEYKLDQALKEMLNKFRACDPPGGLDLVGFSPDDMLLDIEEEAVASKRFDKLQLMHTVDRETKSTIWVLLGAVADQRYILAQQYDDQRAPAILSVRNLRSQKPVAQPVDSAQKKQWTTMRPAGTFEKSSGPSHPLPSRTDVRLRKAAAHARHREIKRRCIAAELYGTLDFRPARKLTGPYYLGFLVGLELWSSVFIGVFMAFTFIAIYMFGVQCLKLYAKGGATKPSDTSKH